MGVSELDLTLIRNLGMVKENELIERVLKHR
jgi:hypothetical protein